MAGILLLILAAAAPTVEDLDWLAGYWLSCRGDSEVSESWSDARSGVLLGVGLTRSSNGASWEQLRIEAGPDGALFLHASPKGQAPARFRLTHSAPGEARFENPAHDFPQSVTYRRDGDRLVGRIEGKSNGQVRSASWQYERASLNARCSAEKSRS